MFHYTRCIPTELFRGWRGVEFKKAIRTTRQSGDPLLSRLKAGDSIMTDDGNSYKVRSTYILVVYVDNGVEIIFCKLV